MGGGGLVTPGVKNVTAYSPPAAGWSRLASTNYTTWYASSTILPNGNVLRLGGVNGCNNCNPEVPEIYSPTADTWTPLLQNPTLLPMYPFTYVRPDGTIAVTGASEVMSPLRIYDPSTQTWTTSDPNVVDGGSAAMYDLGKVIKAGSATDSGVPPTASSPTAYVTDLGQPSPHWTATGSMSNLRSFLNLTPLPDGTVLATGGETTKDGSNLGNGVLPAEDWNPATGGWTTLASLTVPRLYHSIALLLPDGRVFVSGTGNDASANVPDELNAQIFSPPYLFKGPRPTITAAPGTVAYGTAFTVTTSASTSIRTVSLIRSSAVTHAFDESTRRISLPFSAANGVLTVSAPANGAAAPPGDYMLFVVDANGVPSVASWVHLPAPYEDTVAPTAPTNLTATATSATSVALSWTASTDNVGVAGYNVLRNGARIATAAGPSYTDTTVAGGTTYSYTVVAFDAAGNMSPPSGAASVTTPASGPPPTISNVTATAVDVTATVTWTTDQPATSQVFYGTSAGYGSATTLDGALVTSHTQTIGGLTPGQTYHYQVRSTTGSGGSAASTDATFTTAGRPPPAIDKEVSTHLTAPAATITSPAFSTTQGNELLVAFVAADGTSDGSPQSMGAVTGGGLTWTLRSRSNAQAGTSEIWQAVAPSALTGATVTAAFKSGSYLGALTVVAFSGANTSFTGATAAASGPSGAPSASLTTTGASSWVFAVGNDYDNAIGRTVGPGQVLVDQDLSPLGDTYWVQRQGGPTAASGTSVTINDTAPTADRWNLALIEIPGG